MTSISKNISVILGLTAGVAFTAFVLSKKGKNTIKKISDTAATIKSEIDSDLSESKDITAIHRVSKQFI